MRQPFGLPGRTHGLIPLLNKDIFLFSILSKQPYLLLFGVFELLFSAPGQTFLISLFVKPIFDEINVSQSAFAGLYSAATLGASLLLNPAGRLIDKHSTKTIVILNTVLMAAGCCILAASTTLVTLFIGFFAVRLMGQGVYGLTASTLIIKQFKKNRGKAMGVITLGFPISELIYPSLALWLLGAVGWRMSYAFFGLSNLLLMLPLQLWLIAKANIKEGHFLPGESELNPQLLPGAGGERKIRPHEDWTLGRCLKNVKFYLLIAASCIPPTIMTGLLFHQTTLFNTQRWPIELAATGLGVYALTKAVGSICIGPVIDRHGPLPSFVALIATIAAGTFLASVNGPSWLIFAYFGLLGAALGVSSPIMNVVWPHFYGTKHMGSIKGFIGTIRNGLTALGPLPIAMAIDGGISIHSVLRWTALMIFVMASLPLIVWWMDHRELKGLTY